MSKRPVKARALVVALALAIAAIAPASTTAAPNAVDHCFNGATDLNAQYGVDEPIVWYTCTELGSGQDFRVEQGWGMGSKFRKVPKEFVPAGDTPLQDFLAKVIGRKVIVDPGTIDERVYAFTNVADLRVQVDSKGSVVSGVRLGKLPPLSVGVHVIQASWTMSAMHCDGLGGCIQAGDNPDFPFEIEVLPRH